jgi:hypothetical protein
MFRIASTLLLLCLGGVAAAQTRTGQTGAPGPDFALQSYLPSWWKLSVEERVRFESNQGFASRPDLDDNYVLHRLRFDTQFTIPGHFQLYLQAQDSRAFGYGTSPAPTSVQDRIDLRQAYLDWGDEETRNVRVRVGRQRLVFGEGRLVADPDWSNVGRAFDAARVTARFGPLKVDAFAASVVEAADGNWNRHRDANNLHGAYGSIGQVVPGATLEPYVFWRLDPRSKTERGAAARLDTKTAGIRWFGKVGKSADYTVEAALQRGSVGADAARAWAGHWVLGRTFKAVRWAPRLFGEYDYASGDRDSKDGVQGAFDQLYPSSHDRFGLADQYMWRNNHHAHVGLELAVAKKWKLAGGAHSQWLASPTDGVWRSSKLIVKAPAGNRDRHVSDEADIQVFWSPTPFTKVNAGWGWIVPGAFLRAANPSVLRSYVFVGVARRL